MTSLFLEAYGSPREEAMPNWMREERYMYCDNSAVTTLVSKTSFLQRLLQFFHNISLKNCC